MYIVVWVVVEIIRAVGSICSTSSSSTLCISVVRVQLATFVLASSAGGRRLPVFTTNACGNRRRSTEPTVRADAFAASFFINQHDHPDANRARMADQWCAVNPTRATLTLTILIRACQPTDLSGHTATFFQSGREVGTNTWRATNAVKER